MRAVNIEWDIDEEDGIVDGSLPAEVELPRDTEPEDVADYLSDTYSFCVFGFDISYDETDRVMKLIKEINSNLAKLSEYKPEIVDGECNSTELVLDGLEYDTDENIVRVWSHNK